MSTRSAAGCWRADGARARMRSRTKKPGAAPGPNLAGRETALIEALWRGDELAAALSAAQSALAARERDLARAQEAIAELSEIVDAVQAALDDLRAKAADAGERFRLALRTEEDAPAMARKSRLRRWWSRMTL